MEIEYMQTAYGIYYIYSKNDKKKTCISLDAVCIIYKIYYNSEIKFKVILKYRKVSDAIVWQVNNTKR